MAFKNVFILLVLACLLVNATARRDLAIKQGFDIAARVETGRGFVNCWAVLMELKYCSNEIVLSSLQGQRHLCPGCCHAIETVINRCWPSLLTTLGLTAKNGNVLQSYCDGASRSVAVRLPGSKTQHPSRTT